jgi:hypothetical protein
MDKQQQDAFREAVEQKAAAAKEASHQPAPHGDPATEKVTLDATGTAQPGLKTDDTNQDAFDPRDKNTQHKKVTADKWNQ